MIDKQHTYFREEYDTSHLKGEATKFINNLNQLELYVKEKDPAYQENIEYYVNKNDLKTPQMKEVKRIFLKVREFIYEYKSELHQSLLDYVRAVLSDLAEIMNPEEELKELDYKQGDEKNFKVKIEQLLNNIYQEVDRRSKSFSGLGEPEGFVDYPPKN